MKKLLAVFLVLGLILYLGCAQETKKPGAKGGAAPSTTKDKDKKPADAKAGPAADKPIAKPEAAPVKDEKADKPAKDEKADKPTKDEKADKPTTPPPAGKAGDAKPK